ncbi:lactadherin-like [Ciona intestinalis]
MRETKSQQPEEICIRTNTNPGRPTIPNPGTPGKRGPPGGKGDKGDVGPTGQCVCDGMSQLLQEIQQLNLTHCSVGMKDRRVRDEDIASATHESQINTYYHPKNARLDNVQTAHQIGAWASGNREYSELGLVTAHNNINNIFVVTAGNWIQVDLKSPTLLTGVVTQGRPGGRYMQWVRSYKIAYGINQTSFQTIQNSDGTDVIFQGNTDINTKVTNMFPAPIIARYVRLIHITYHDWATIRLEYLTC